MDSHKLDDLPTFPFVFKCNALKTLAWITIKYVWNIHLPMNINCYVTIQRLIQSVPLAQCQLGLALTLPLLVSQVYSTMLNCLKECYIQLYISISLNWIYKHVGYVAR